MDLSSGKVIKEGTLNTRGSLKLWSSRYIVVYSNKSLASFKKKQHYTEKKKPSSVISLEDTTVVNADATTKKSYSFQIQQKSTGNELKAFAASSESERNSWMNAIKNAMIGNEVRATPSPSMSEEKPPTSISNNSSGTKSIESTESASSSNKKESKKEVNSVPLTVFSKERLEKLFEQYEDKEENLETPTIGPSGIEKFCKDLDVDPENVVVLVMAWSIGAKKMGFFEKSEFISGFEKLSCDTIDKIKNKLKELRKNLDDDTKFKEIYKWAFNFGKEPTQRSLDSEFAAALLKLLTKDKKNKFPYCEDFCEFLTTASKFKALNIDHWMSFYQFNKIVKPDFSNFNSEDAWPTMLDEFVEWKKNKSKENKSESTSS